MSVNAGMGPSFPVGCDECGEVLPDHREGCLRDLVDRDEITPRQRQIAIHDAKARLAVLCVASIGGVRGSLREAVLFRGRGLRDYETVVNPKIVVDFADSLGVEFNPDDPSPLRVDGVKVHRSSAVPRDRILAVSAEALAGEDFDELYRRSCGSVRGQSDQSLGRPVFQGGGEVRLGVDFGVDTPNGVFTLSGKADQLMKYSNFSASKVAHNFATSVFT